MRTIAFLAFSTVLASGFAQQPVPQLSEPKPFDFNVTSLQWHPNGDALVYTKKTKDGFAVGVYRTGQDEGQAVIPIKKGDRHQTVWLAGTKHAICSVTRSEVEGANKISRIQVYLINSESQTSALLLDRPYAAEENPSVFLDASPKLLHAIVQIFTGAKNKEAKSDYYVLKTNGQDLSPSPDLNAAAKQGLSGPTWSIDGTAVYAAQPGGKAISGAPFSVSNDVVEVSGRGNGEVGGTGEAVITLRAREVKGQEVALISLAKNGEAGELILDTGSLFTATFRAVPPAPAVGANVMELMPQNGSLRSVKFRGPWNQATNSDPVLAPRDHQISIEYGKSRAQSKSIWLTSPDKNAATGTLISANATKAWLAPYTRAVAYLSDGALFLREIK